MENKKINYGLIAFIIVVIILFLPIIADYYKSRNIIVLNSDELFTKLNEGNENFIVFVGNPTKAETKELRKIRGKVVGDYSYKYTVYSIEDSKEVDEILGEKTEVAVIIEGDIQKVYNDYKYDIIDNYAETFLIGNIDDNNKSYKVADNFTFYKKIVKSDDVTMTVFGRNTCSYCNLFKVVYNAIADKYNLDIYYFDSDSYDKDDYTKIVNLDLTVPSKCSSSGKSFKLSEGFGTPLTIFTRKGKIVDCIGGYVNRSSLVDKLTSLEMISE